MCTKVNITENHLRILSLFTNDYDSEYYIRETSKKLNISSRTAHKILNDLEKKGVLKAKLKGKIKEYSLNKKNPISFDYIVFTENYKLVSFLQNNPDIKQLLHDISSTLDGVLLVFGSYAKGTQKEKSDLDLLLLTEKTPDKDNLNKILKRYSIEVNIKYSPLFELDKEDFLIKEVAKNHICVKNIQDYVKLMW